MPKTSAFEAGRAASASARCNTSIYWGDIDTHGFEILNRIREISPRSVISLRVSSDPRPVGRGFSLPGDGPLGRRGSSVVSMRWAGCWCCRGGIGLKPTSLGRASRTVPDLPDPPSCRARRWMVAPATRVTRTFWSRSR
ncbi:Wadjet anti-phage system protein JetD domain-containing protein [Micromonospora sp. NPDC049171]|uniref:Wadjet anti-phage system protein JetD domain-containing protein n=1 Tax=Micromonospora sp. NPDC049171 TaxID=3155770 RepID=UPI0033FB38F3